MKPASVRLLIHIIAKNATQGKTLIETVNDLKNLDETVRKAKTELDQYIDVVRSAHDANPNWTVDEICQMIIDRLFEKDPTLFRNIK